MSQNLNSAVAVVGIDIGKNSRVAANGAKGQDQTRADAANCNYSITSSARASSVAGMSIPIIFAALALITSSNFVGC